MLVARFTGPRQACFAASDVTAVYGVTPRNFIQSEVGIHATSITFIVARQVKRGTSLFNTFCSNVAKKVARFLFNTFLLPVLPSLPEDETKRVMQLFLKKYV